MTHIVKLMDGRIQLTELDDRGKSVPLANDYAEQDHTEWPLDGCPAGDEAARDFAVKALRSAGWKPIQGARWTNDSTLKVDRT